MNGSLDQPLPQLLAARVTLADFARTSSEFSAQHPVLSVVVPLFDEEANLAELLSRLRGVLDAQLLSYELLFVNDGSRDRTGVLLDLLVASDPNLVVIHLSRNFGHQAAVSAGLQAARGEAIIVLDGDLQDPPEIIPQLIHRWRNGSEVVYAVRATRQEGLGLKLGYSLFYRLLSYWADHPIPVDAGDFCLMDRRVADVLIQAKEQPRFLRGLRAFAGFRQTAVAYDRASRFAGRSKYTLAKLFRLAMDGFFLHTRSPVRMLWLLAWSSLAVPSVLVCYGILTEAFVLRPGEQLLAAGLALSTASILFAVAILGEYLGRIYTEIQGRPPFIIREIRRMNQPASEGVHHS